MVFPLQIDLFCLKFFFDLYFFLIPLRSLFTTLHALFDIDANIVGEEGMDLRKQINGRKEIHNINM